MVVLRDNSVSFMLTNVVAKVALAFAQLYSIAVFSRLHSPEEASLIFILLGYSVWFQIFDFGFSQAIQNRFNNRSISIRGIYAIVATHFYVMLILAGIALWNHDVTKFLLPSYGQQYNHLSSFSTGIALMMISVNNVVLQRLLLIANKGKRGNLLLLLQSVIFIGLIAVYENIAEFHLKISIALCFLPQILVFLPTLSKILIKVWTRRLCKEASFKLFLKDASGFWIVSLASTLFIGSDYFFVSHFLSPDQVAQYHLASRSFFISFAAYYAYAQHRARHLNFEKFIINEKLIFLASIQSIYIGLISVLTVFGLVYVAAVAGWLSYILVGVQFDRGILISAALYFGVRVPRDVGVLLLWNLGLKAALIFVYLSELTLAFIMLSELIVVESGIDIFNSMASACLLAVIMILVSRIFIKNAYGIEDANENR